MNLILACGIGIMTGSGVWLLLRPRTFQVISGLSLLSYAVNLFLFCTGGIKIDSPAIFKEISQPLRDYADPVPQSLVLTAIVIGFSTTAFILVLLLIMRGISGSDHVDGYEPNSIIVQKNLSRKDLDCIKNKDIKNDKDLKK